MNQVLTNAYELRDIRPPVAIPDLWILVWLWLSLFVLVTLAVLGWEFWFKPRKARALFVPPVPAHIRARQKLEEALGLLAQPKMFCTLVSDAIRYYLEERFDFHAPDRTTEEFLHELRNTKLLLPDQKDSLGEFLKRCDLVKFARYEPGEPELRDLYDSALRLVEETEPQPEPVAVEAPVGNPPSAIASPT